MRTLIQDFVVRRPDWRRETTVKLDNGTIVRATVERDFYAKQNSIYSEVWSDATASWNRVQSLGGADYAHLPSSGSKDNDAIFAESQQVIDEMIDYVEVVTA